MQYYTTFERKQRVSAASFALSFTKLILRQFGPHRSSRRRRSLIISHRVNWFVSVSLCTPTTYKCIKKKKRKKISVRIGFIYSPDIVVVVTRCSRGWEYARSPDCGKWLISIIRSRTTGDYNIHAHASDLFALASPYRLPYVLPPPPHLFAQYS